MEIFNAWHVKDTEPMANLGFNSTMMSFPHPILVLIAGKTEGLRYRLWYSKANGLKDVRYQKLQVITDNSDIEVVMGVEIVKQKDIIRLEPDYCIHEILPSEYQKIADSFRESDNAIEAKRLFDKLKTLEDAVRGALQDIMRHPRSYIEPNGECCPISQLTSRK
jgi:hypothetical protein